MVVVENLESWPTTEQQVGLPHLAVSSRRKLFCMLICLLALLSWGPQEQKQLNMWCWQDSSGWMESELCQNLSSEAFDMC